MQNLLNKSSNLYILFLIKRSYFKDFKHPTWLKKLVINTLAGRCGVRDRSGFVSCRIIIFCYINSFTSFGLYMLWTLTKSKLMDLANHCYQVEMPIFILIYAYFLQLSTCKISPLSSSEIWHLWPSMVQFSCLIC